MTTARLRVFAVAAAAVSGLAVVLLPWYSLDTYEPNGWDATWWARAAAIAAIAAIAALRFRCYRLATLIAAVCAACIAYRTAQPPDFGFGFDGLTVPVERQAGCWVALGSSLLALLSSARLAWARPPAPSSAAAAP